MCGRGTHCWLPDIGGLTRQMGQNYSDTETGNTSGLASYKQALGGAMRQAGIIAAGGVYALRHHVDRLAEDHDNARAFARGIAGLRGIALDPAHVETNIVIFEVKQPWSAKTLAQKFGEHNIRCIAISPTQIRLVTHLDISEQMVREVISFIQQL